MPNVKQVLFLNGSVVLLFCCFLKTCFSRKRLDALVTCQVVLVVGGPWGPEWKVHGCCGQNLESVYAEVFLDSLLYENSDKSDISL